MTTATATATAMMTMMKPVEDVGEDDDNSPPDEAEVSPRPLQLVGCIRVRIVVGAAYNTFYVRCSHHRHVPWLWQGVGVFPGQLLSLSFSLRQGLHLRSSLALAG